MRVQVTIGGLLGEGLESILRGAGLEVVSEGADVEVVGKIDLLSEVGVKRLALTDGATGFVAAMKTGRVSGCIPKTSGGSEFVNAVRIVGQGGLYVHQSMVSDVATNGGKARRVLTLREVDVMRLVVMGYKNREVGNILDISTRTVENHRRNALGKLGLRERWELVRWWRENGGE